MSRNLIVGLSVLIVAILAWIAISAVIVPPPPAVETVTPDETSVPEIVESDPVPETPVTPEPEISASPAGEGTVPDDAASVSAADTSPVEEPAGDAVEQDAEDSAAATTTEVVDDAASAPGTAPAAATVIGGSTSEGASDDSGPVDAVTDSSGEVGDETDDVDAADNAPTTQDPTTAGNVPQAATVVPAVPRREDLAGLLTPEGFRAAPLLAYLEQADLADDERADMRAAIERAQADPVEIPAVIAELKDGLDIQ